jgi:hypothetical protein
MMNSNTVVDIEKHNQLQKEREETFGLDEFKQWCKDLNIGVRVERDNDSRIRARELQLQYEENYPKWSAYYIKKGLV